jgi:multicomponent Na+:H+ antiporter subunit G
MNWLDIVSIVFLLCGCFFYFAGSIGVVRFPDSLSRLHAVTKADSLGLGLLVIGLLFQVPSVAAAFKLLLIWLLVLISSAAACQLVARAALLSGASAGSKP